MSDRDRLKHLFAVARSLPPEQRDAFLAAAAADAPQVRDEVASLLQFDVEGDDPLEHGPRTLVREVALGLVEPPAVGDLVGPWRIVDVAGRGGMGIVYRAVRADAAFDSVVALKFIHAGLESQELVARFGRERDVLASLDHPHIARLLDAGVTPRGTPYVAMEFVDGQSITRFADRQGLDVDARLRLFCDVCDAVEHAHRHLVIHRDLKPDNILVTTGGQVKLVDFGLAKLLDDADDGVQTVTRLMTPTYASPEQLVGATLTTAADVYALAVVLYELLTGRLPHPAGERQRDLAAVVRGDSPRPPSIAIAAGAAGAGARMPTTATTARWRRRLAGDLDAIVLKALRHAPGARYQTAVAFADDLRRHLEGRTVSARRGTWRYRATTFARRNVIGVAASAITAIALVAGAGATWWQATAAARERDRARIEQQRAEQTVAFVQEMLGAPSPTADGRDVKVADLLARARARADVDLVEQPRLRASVLLTIGRTYFGLGLYDDAASVAGAGVDLLKQLGAEPAVVADALVTYGEILNEQGDIERAGAILGESVALAERLSPADPALLASALNELSSVHYAADRLDDAEALDRRAMELRRGLGPAHARDLLESLNDLGVVVGSRGRYAEARVFHEEALAIGRRELGADHPDVASTLGSLAFVTLRLGDAAAAEQAYREAIDIRQRVLGREHPDTLWVQYLYAALLSDTKRYDEALVQIAPVRAARGTALPEAHPLASASEQIAGSALLGLNRLDEAERPLRESLRMRQAQLPADHWQILAARSTLAGWLIARQRYPEAEAELRVVYPAMRAKLGPDHAQVKVARERVRALYAAWHKPVTIPLD